MTTEIKSYPIDHLTLLGKDDNDALIVKNQVYTYKMLNLRIATLAFWLRDKGLQKGDRAASWIGKGVLASIMPLAAARAGLIYVPINPLLKAQQVEYIMDDSGAKLIIANKARLNSLNHIDTIFSADDEKLVAEMIENMIDVYPDNQLAPSEGNIDDLAAILYTSGSTGKPKGVMLSHKNLWLGAVSVAQYLKLDEGDRTLAVLPLSFDYGQNQLYSTWFAGGAVVPLDYLTPKDVVKSCLKYQITTLAAVPPLWVQLCEYDWGEAAQSIQRITNSGGALTLSLVKDLTAIFKDADVYAMYGLTEAFRSTFLDPKLLQDNPLSMGKAIPFAEIMVVNADGLKAAPNEHGELVHAGPLVAKGYWQDPERSAVRFKPAPQFSKYASCDGYDTIAVWSGDTVFRDEDGLLYFVGRDDAMIKTSGNRVSPGEIEEAAIATGFAAEACAIGQKDERIGEAIILFVRPAVNMDKDDGDLKMSLQSALPNFMHPKRIIWIAEFPKNANGKIDRNLLQNQLETNLYSSVGNET